MEREEKTITITEDKLPAPEGQERRRRVVGQTLNTSFPQYASVVRCTEQAYGLLRFVYKREIKFLVFVL